MLCKVKLVTGTVFVGQELFFLDIPTITEILLMRKDFKLS